MSKEQLKRYTVIQKTLEGAMTIKEAAVFFEPKCTQGNTPDIRSEGKWGRDTYP
ncbi:hypothetical protein SAMN05660826_01403 [Caldanaerovirga acetigignens]|uniref:Uncharacterized protein n=1 Tax=Caldanaerovirga acetigignens TaxID=447595 RepID=A0A1M7JZ06_9FIRM|nr:hypothetical protein SAMN05660826_01403 [Caldanaerovirga acetigignens]